MFFNIQALRALAASVVIFVHLAPLLAPIGIRNEYLAFGEVGVDLFFVISGYVLVYSMRRNPVTATDFMLNRVIRVIPLYWLLTIATFSVALAWPSLVGATRASWPDLIKSLLFIPFKKESGLIVPVLFVGWTLNFEMLFYAVFAFSIFVAMRSPGTTVVLTITLLVGLVIAGGTFAPHDVIARTFTSPLMLEFGFGMILGWFGGREPRVSRAVALGIAVAALVVLVTLPFTPVGLPRVLSAGIPAAIALWASLAAERGGFIVRNPRVQYLGAASYALYLTHPFPLQVASKVSQRYNSVPISLILTLAAFVGAVFIAVVVHRFVEVPITKTLRRLVGHDVSVVQRREQTP